MTTYEAWTGGPPDRFERPETDEQESCPECGRREWRVGTEDEGLAVVCNWCRPYQYKLDFRKETC